MLITSKLIKIYLLKLKSERSTISDSAVRGLSLEIRPSGEGSWRFRYTFEGKQECISIGLLSETTVDDARKISVHLLSQIHGGVNPRNYLGNNAGSIKKSITFECFVSDYYIPHINSYKRCITADLTLLKNHLLPAFGNISMDRITRENVLEFQLRKKEAGYKPAYCNRFLILLGFCFNLAIKWEIPGVKGNPVKLVPLLKANNKIERFVTPEESVRLMEAINLSPNPLLKYFVTLALLTGLRKREILDAMWVDIDFENMIWTVPLSKSGYSRCVPLNRDTYNVLIALKQEVSGLLNKTGFVENEFLIPNWQTRKPFKSIFDSWNSARISASLPDLRIHDLRHSFASALVNQGIPIYEVQKLLGHSNIKTTERYAHLSIDKLRQSTVAASNYFNLPPKMKENCG